jgi:hypothetical protein
MIFHKTSLGKIVRLLGKQEFCAQQPAPKNTQITYLDDGKLAQRLPTVGAAISHGLPHDLVVS